MFALAPSLSLIYSPFPDSDSARAAASVLLQARLVACCNVLPGIESHYWWEGQLTSAQEVILLCKMLPANTQAVAEKLAAIHPYETPAILTFAAEANPAFAHWVAVETNTADSA